MKKSLLTLFFLSILGAAMAQKPKIKDNPIQREQYELMKLKNPASGKIPLNIRKKELFFASQLNSKAKRTNQNISTEWSHRGPYNVGGRTRALAVDVANENTILAGGVSGGLWRSTDQGSNWSKSTSSLDIHSITCIAQDTREGETNTWYYGTGEFSGNSASGNGSDDFFLGDGIFKSIDNGISWTVLPSTESKTPEQFTSNTFQINNEIVVNPSNGDVLVANFFGIQRSQDGGVTFAEVLTNSLSGWSDIKTTSNGVLYATLEGVGIFESLDNGDTWTDITDTSYPSSNGDRIELAIAPSNEEIIYVIGENGGSHTLWKFDNSDDSWIDLSANIPMLGGNVGNFTSQGGYDLLIEVKPDDENFVVIGGTNLYRSIDGFASTSNTAWIGGYSTLNNISLYTDHHPDQHAFIFLSGNRALSGNDGGVQLTNDITDDRANGDGETVDWIWLNNGYLTTQVYALSKGPGDQIMAGFQDNSTWLSTSADGDIDWTDQFSGDGAYNDFNLNGTKRYMSAQNAIIYRVRYPSANSHTPNSFVQIDPTDGYSTSLFITPFYLDPLDEELFYLGGDNDLYINTQVGSANQTVGWKSISLGNSGIISEFGLTNSNMVYVGTSAGELYKVENPGSSTPTISDITDLNFPSGYVSGIGVNSSDEKELLVSFSNYGILSIYHSLDGGSSWAEVGGNLEENPDGSGDGPSVRTTEIGGDGLIYLVGTSTGVYSSVELDGSSTVWTQEGSSEIGNVVVSHMVKDDNEIIIGTHGSGLFSVDISVAIDLSVALDEPSSQEFVESSDVTATISNNGDEPVSQFDISLTIDDILVVTDNVTQSIASGEDYKHTFSVKYDFTGLGAYDVEVSISLSGDTNTGNNVDSETVLSLATPTDIQLSNNTISEEEPIGTQIGSLSTLDEDDTEHTYTLISGEGDSDNASFDINTSNLVSQKIFDFDGQSSFSIRIQTEDGDGYTFAKSFYIDVNDVLNVKEIENAGITMFPNPFKSNVNLEMINDYIGTIKIRIFSLDGKNLVFVKDYFKEKQITNSLLNLETISSGHYLIKFEYDSKVISGKLIKE